MQLSDLPDETLQQILLFLSLRDLLSVCATNKRIRKLYYEAPVQYKAELEATGHQEMPTVPGDSIDSSSIQQRLSYLRNREARWHKPTLLKRAVGLTMPGNVSFSLYDITAGIFIYGDGEPGSGLKYLNIEEISRDSGSITDISEHDIPMLSVAWQDFPFPGDLLDFGMALVEHDLIALVSSEKRGVEIQGSQSRVQDIRVHFLTFSTGQPHAKANEPVIKLTDKSPIRPIAVLEIVGNYAVILLKYPHARKEIEELFIFNWKSGHQVERQTYSQPTYGALSFITPSLFVMPNRIQNSLDLFHILVSRDDNNVSEQVCCLRRLGLPELVDEWQITSAECRGDPNPMGSIPDCLASTYPQATGSGVQTKKWNTSVHKIMANPSVAIITFNFVLFSADTFSFASLNLVVHRSALARLALDTLDNFEKSSAIDRSSTDVHKVHITKWEDWCQGIVRWHLVNDPNEWITTTAGQRQVLRSEAKDTLEPIIILRDYNPYTVRRTKCAGKAVHVDSRDGIPFCDWEIEDEGDGDEDEGGEHEARDDDGGDGGLKDVNAGEGTPTCAVPKFSCRSVRVRDMRTDFHSVYFKKGAVQSDLPCVEYITKGDSNMYSGLSLDDERIIGYLEDTRDDMIKHILIFSMAP